MSLGNHYLQDQVGGTLGGNENFARIAHAHGFEAFTLREKWLAGYFITQIRELESRLDAIEHPPKPPLQLLPPVPEIAAPKWSSHAAKPEPEPSSAAGSKRRGPNG